MRVHLGEYEALEGKLNASPLKESVRNSAVKQTSCPVFYLTAQADLPK